MLDDLPSNWTDLTARQVASEKGLQTGPFGSQLKASEYVEKDSPDLFFVVMPKDIINNQIDFSACARIKPSKAEVLERHWLEEGDVLFARRGDLSKVAIFQTEGIKAICGTGCLRLRPDRSIAAHQFLRAVITSYGAIEWLKTHAVGATMPNLNTEIIGKLPLRLPPLPEQERIAEVLSSVDDSIRATEAVIAQAERVKRGLMEDLLTGGLGSEAIARGEVPEGWLMKQIGDLANVRGGKRMPKGAPFSEVPTPYPYIRVSDLKSGSISKADLKYVSAEHQRQISRYTISKDDLYISIAGTLGIVGLVPDDLDGAQLTENAAKLVLKNPSLVNKGYLVRVLQSDVGQSQIHIKKGVGGGVPKLALFRIAEINVPVPPEEEQIRIAKVGGAVDAMLTDNRQTVDQLLRVKRGLMDDLLTGRVRTM